MNLSVFQSAERYLIIFLIRASNHMFGRNIWDKLPEFIFENFKKEGDLSRKLLEPNIWLLVNHTKSTNSLY